MKAVVKKNALEIYKQVLPGELEAQDDQGKEVIAFLNKIAGKEIEVVQTCGDWFEKEDNNIWLPDELFESI